MARRLGELIERGSEPLDADARGRVEKWRSRADRILLVWIGVAVLLPATIYPVILAALRIQGNLLQAASLVLMIVVFGLGFPAALLSVRDCWQRSARLSRDLRGGEVELWAGNPDGPFVRRLPHSGWLVDEEGSGRRKLERQPVQEVADVPLSAYWLSVPQEETPPGTPPLERRRLSEEELSELRGHLSRRTRALWALLAGIVFLCLQAARLWILQAEKGPLSLGYVVLCVTAGLAWYASRAARIVWKLREDAQLGRVVAAADLRENEYLAASGIEWTVGGGPAPWRR